MTRTEFETLEVGTTVYNLAGTFPEVRIIFRAGVKAVQFAPFTDRAAVAGIDGWSDDAIAQATTELVIDPAPIRIVETIDLTPMGYSKPGGAERIANAVDAFNSAGHAVANIAAQLLSTYDYVLNDVVINYKGREDFEELLECIDTLRGKIGDRAKAQDEFLRAVSGR
jgi:hypothetical protein